MFGSKSLEQQLRESSGKTATATVLTAKEGLDWQMSGFKANDASGAGGPVMTKHRYTLRVEPQGEEPFEAKIVMREDKLGRWRAASLTPGATAHVLYDPDDHGKVAFDFAAMDGATPPEQVNASVDAFHRLVGATAAAARPSMPTAGGGSGPGSEIEKLKELADLRDRGALTEAEFEAEKAKLLT